MAGFTKFDKIDWDGMAGAEPFADGSDPLICYEIKVDDLETWAVIDGHGFYLEIMTPEADVIGTITSEPENAAAIMRFLASMESHYDNGAFHYTTGELVDMGLEPRPQVH